MTHQFGVILKELLLNPKLRDSKLVFYTAPDVASITNAVYLLGSFMVVYLGMTPDDAWTPFASIVPSPFRPYRDATWAPSPFDLTVKDCWAGLIKAREAGMYTPESFDKDVSSTGRLSR
jgi:cell division cycle 14